MPTPKPFYGFVSGEVAPDFYGRTDLTKFDLGVSEAYNFYVDYRGGLVYRGGLEFTAPLKGNDPVRLFKFGALNDDYILVLGHLYMRFVRSGGYLLESAKTITALTAATTGVVTAAAHGYSTGDWVYLSGVVGPIELNQRYFEVGAVTTNTFQLLSPEAEAINTSSFDAWTSGGTVAKVVTIPTPFTGPSLKDIKATQRRSVEMRFTSLDYPRYRLLYTSDTSWTLSEIITSPNIAAPTGVALSPSDAGTAGVAFAVTAVVDSIEGIPSSYAINRLSVDYANETAGSMKVTWDAVPLADSYNIYRSLLLPSGEDVTTGQELGYLGRSFGPQFTDNNIIPDFTKSPPQFLNPFDDDNNPRAFTMFQQRETYAGTLTEPMGLWAGKPGALDNFDVSSIVNASDSYSFTFDGTEVDPIYHLLTLRSGLLVFNASSITLLRAEEGTAVSGINALAEPQAYRGVSSVEPLLIDLDVLFVQRKSTALNAMVYTEYTNSFSMQDISVLSSHLFGEGRRITRMQWVAEPYKLLYSVKEDGSCTITTYERTQEVFGFAQMWTKGLFKDLLAVEEGGRDLFYTVVERFINGKYVQYLERSRQRNFNLSEDFWGVDSGLEYIRSTPNARLTFSGNTNSITITASSSVFVSANVGDIIYAYGGKMEVTAFTSGTVITATVLRAFTKLSPETSGQPLQAAQGVWEIGAPVSELTNLWHLEGEDVSVLADGSVYLDQRITGGRLALPQPATKITVGIPYVGRVKTLPVNLRQQATEGLRKNIKGVSTRLKGTRGLAIGTTTEDLQEYANRTDEDWGEAINALDEVVYQHLNSGWDEDQQVIYQQSYPLPAAILSTVFDVELGDD